MNMEILAQETMREVISALTMGDQQRASAAIVAGANRALRWKNEEETLREFFAMLETAARLQFPGVPISMTVEIGGETLRLDITQA